jgi:hypothetical protein
MRRILLAAFALLLLGAAPAMASECRNLALAGNGGVASVSSVYNSAYSADTLINGRRENPNLGTYYWIDSTWDTWPDWAEVQWSSARTIGRIVLVAPIIRGVYGNELTPARTLSRVRVQYWDSATSAWVDVVGRRGQDNPIVDWVTAWGTSDGSELRKFDLTPVTTTKIRVQFEGSPHGYSWMDEIEAYENGEDCDPPASVCTNRALDGTVTASSTHSSGLYPLSGVTNGQRESGATKGYWNDDTNGVWPDWVQAAWTRPIEVNRIVARIPLAETGFPLGEITMRRTRIQYWDSATAAWVDVVGRTGQDNPILDWTGPIGRADGTETKSFDLATPVTTTKVRVLIEDGSTDGWSWLDELEVYSSDCVVAPRDTNVALSGTASASSTWSGYDTAFVNDGRRQTTTDDGYWRDTTAYISDDWVAIDWDAPQTLNRIILRMPWFGVDSWPPVNQTYGAVRVQYWDESTPRWVDVRSTQDNPALNWLIPERADGTEVKQFDFTTVTARRVRVLFDEATTLGWSFLEEFEAYWIS